MSAFDKLIDELRKANGGSDDEIITELLARRDKLGELATEDEIREEISEILKEKLASLLDAEDDEEEDAVVDEDNIVLDGDDQAYMDRACASVEEFLDSNEWHYSSRVPRADVHVYELGFNVENCNLRVRIYVEADPNVCRIDAVLPINADPLYVYPLCEKIANFNYIKRFGSLKYDRRDGEITYEYSFMIGNGIYQDDIDRYFHAVISSADDAYAEIKKCCVGRFKSKEVNEILTKVDKLVEDISDD